MFTIQEEGPSLKLGEEVYSVEAEEGETLEQFVTPDVPEGVYLFITRYESELGEVSHGFKVELYK